MDRRRVVITGMGLVSPLPSSLEHFQEALVSRKGAVRPFLWNDKIIHSVSVAAPALFEGTIEDFDLHDAGQKKVIKKALKVMSREIQMAVASSCRALFHANIQFGQFPSQRIGISFGSDYILTTVEDVIDGIRACCNCLKNSNGLENSKSSKDSNGSENSETRASFDFSRWASEGLTKMQPLWQLKYLPNMPSSHIAIINNFHGPSNSITLREASVGACVGESVEIIASGRADIMIVGTTGSRLHPLKMLHAIQQEELTSTACKPFDRNRDGTVLGEGAGAVVLEELEHAQKRNATIWGEVVCGSYRTRYDQKKTDRKREVIKSVLCDVLRRSGMEPEQIGHINAHGLGSRESDHAEALAIHDVFGNRKKPIPLSAAKGFFGNLGAGGGTVELIVGVLALQRELLFPTLNFSTPDPECPVTPNQNNNTPSGQSFIKIAVNPQAQASAILVRQFR
jgi:3-oxoacyl-[acyl-carrier-protein] synthase II